MENKYTRDQIKDAIWQELKESDYAGENNERAYEVIGIVMAGIDRIVAGEATPGLSPLLEPILNDEDMKAWESDKRQPSAVWVKASRFKYEEGASYHAKDSESKGAGRFNKDGAFIWGNGTITWPEHRDDLLILDESGTAAGWEDNAVAFAEWIRANHYNPYGNRWRRTGSNLERSSTQLYELFKQKEK